MRAGVSGQFREGVRPQCAAGHGGRGLLLRRGGRGAGHPATERENGGGVRRGDLWENFGELQGVVDIPPLPVGFVASHLETGAISGAAGLIHASRCVWRDYPPCDPKFALLDPVRTSELSRREVVLQGFSALAGALEEYLALTDGMSVSRELLEVLMEGMVRDLRACQQAPGDEDARSNLMWRCALWGSRFFQLGRRFSFPALPVRESAILSASDWEEYAGMLSVLLLSLCRREAERHPAAMARLARRVWGSAGRDEPDQKAAQAVIRAFGEALREQKLPAEYTELDDTLRNRLDPSVFAQNPLVYTA